MFITSSKIAAAVLATSSLTIGSLASVTLDVKNAVAIKEAALLASRWLGYYYQSPFDNAAWDEDVFHWHESGMYWQTYLEYRKWFGDNSTINSYRPRWRKQRIMSKEWSENTLRGKWNDDILWWGLAALAGADNFGTRAMINPYGGEGQRGQTWVYAANTTFFQVMEQLDMTTCNGGIYWSRNRNDLDRKDYKSSITHGQMLLAGAKLYEMTGDVVYKDIADMLYKWMKTYLITSDYIVVDGIKSLRQGDSPDTCGDVTYNPYSYQHGTIIPALAIFYNTTKDETYLNEAHRHFNAFHGYFIDKDGSIYEPLCLLDGFRDRECNKDPEGFSWSVYRGLPLLYAVTPNMTVKNMIQSAVEATALKNFKQCPGTNADWNCVRTLDPVPKEYTFPNGTNPRDQVETMELLAALAIIQGFKPVVPPPVSVQTVPIPISTSTPPKSSVASNVPSVFAYAGAAVLAVAAIFLA
ncbi:glycosyl hydrolase family 76-domain-containing protein [Chytridium lagenaria]|nr:glycosyl hydrolase family 76-domain-containing protein [Chytridium lagenaria]